MEYGFQGQDQISAYDLLELGDLLFGKPKTGNIFGCQILMRADSDRTDAQ
jgi:hypothetical protein